MIPVVPETARPPSRLGPTGRRTGGFRSRLLGLGLGLCLLCCAHGDARGNSAEFRVDTVSTHLFDGVYHLDASLDLSFGDKVLQALFNGVPLTLEIDMRIVAPRQYLWDATVATVEQRYRLRYHALSQLYRVENLNTGVTQNYPSRLAALQALETLRGFPLIDAGLLDSAASHMVEVQVRLDLNALPVPLRAIALVSGDWRLSSAWKSAPLTR